MLDLDIKTLCKHIHYYNHLWHLTDDTSYPKGGSYRNKFLAHKLRLQKILLEQYPSSIEIVKSDDPNIIGINIKDSSFDACHMRIDELRQILKTPLTETEIEPNEK